MRAVVHLGPGVSAAYDPAAGSIRIAAAETETKLNAWILSSPATRAVWGLDYSTGRWRVGLSVADADSRFERLPFGVGATYAEAVENALTIARCAGYE